MTDKKSSLWIANLVAYVITVGVNAVAMLLPLNSITTSQMSAMYPTLVTPPNITFGIWMVIYIALGVFIVTSIFTKVSRDAEAIGPYFIITCVLNVAWLFTWHFQLITLSFLIIVGLLIVLFKIYKITRESSFIAKHTFSIYYAWITVAALVSTFVFGKTMAGGAPVTPIQPRSSSYVLEEPANTGYVDKFYYMDPLLETETPMWEYISMDSDAKDDQIISTSIISDVKDDQIISTNMVTDVKDGQIISTSLVADASKMSDGNMMSDRIVMSDGEAVTANLKDTQIVRADMVADTEDVISDVEEPMTDGTVSLDPPVRELPDVYGDIMLIDAVGEPVPISTVPPEDIWDGRTTGSEDIWDGRIVLIGGDPEIVSYVTTLEYVLATVAVVVVGAITIFHIYRFRDLTYALTILWALGGIAVRQLQSPTPPVYMLIVAAITVLAILYALWDCLIKHEDDCVGHDLTNRYNEMQ